MSSHRSRLRCLFVLLATVLLTVRSLRPQQAQTDAQEGPTFTLSARLVPLDVVVTDKKGNPVHGLKKEDFRIEEDNAPQAIRYFDEHGKEPVKPVPLPPMGNGIYTNFPTTQANESVTVLLLDSLNTGVADQAYVHQQILQFLKTVPPGTQVAIFTLASRLRMLQSFTTDPAILEAVLKDKKTLPKSSVLAGTEFDPAVNASASIQDPTLTVQDNLGGFESDFQTFEQQQRVNITLEALQQLGDYLIGVPGRKNLVWFAGNFPLGLSAGPTGSDPLTDLTPDQAERRALVDTYIRARIAVYPVSAVGLEGDSFTSARQSNRAFASDPTKITQASIQQANSRANERIPMELLAANTGGKAFFDTNGLKQAIDTAVNDGTNYYSLAYTPAEHEYDQQFHKIVVTVNGNYKVSYRRGYYADGPDGITPLAAPAINSSADFQEAMVRGVPNATAILFKIHIGPVAKAPDAKLLGDDTANLNGRTIRYAIDYAASMHTMHITKTSDGEYHIRLTFAAVAYDIDGKALNDLTQQVKLDLKPEAFNDFLKSGLKFQQVLDLPAVPVFLKVGISDPASGKVGTMEIPLQPQAPPEYVPAKDAAPPAASPK